MFNRMKTASFGSIAMIGAVFTLTATDGLAAVKGNKKKGMRHQRAAFRAINVGDIDTGLVELEAAYNAYPHPKFLYNIAVAQEQKPNNCQRAHLAYLRFFNKCLGCRTESLGKSRHDRLLNRCMVPLTIRTVPAGVRITIDEEDLEGMTPIVTKVWAGSRRIAAKLKGYEDEIVDVAVLESTPREVVIRLLMAKGAESVVGDGADSRKPPLQVVGAISEASEKESIPNWAIWTTALTAVVAGGLGVGLGVAAQNEADRVNSNGSLRPAVRADLGDGAQDIAIGANVAFALAGVAAVSTVVLLLWPKTPGDGAIGAEGDLAGPSALSIRW